MAWWHRWLGRPIDLTTNSEPFWRGFFGAETASGEVVTYDSALRLDAVWACVSLIQDTVGTLPCVVYGADGVTPLKDDPLYTLLHDLPSADHTAAEFWSMVAMCLCLDGNFFAEKKLVGGRLVALEPLHPLSVEVKRTDSNARTYEYTENGKKRTISEDRIFHVRGKLVPGCDRGLSPIAAARNVIGNAMAGERVTGAMMKDGLMSSLIVTTDQVLQPDQRTAIYGFIKEFMGAKKAGGVLPLEGGMTPHAINIKPVDAQMLETKQYSVEQIARIFGVPPVMIGHAADGTTTWGSGIEQLILQFSKTCLRPMLERIEGAIYRDILTPEDRKKYKVEFNMEGFLRGDSKARAEFLTKMVGSGIYLIDEARAYENKASVKGGDRAIVNGTMTRLDKLGEVAPVEQKDAA